MSPVTRAAIPETPKVTPIMGPIGPGPTPPRPVKIPDNTSRRVKTAPRPTDHLPGAGAGLLQGEEKGAKV